MEKKFYEKKNHYFEDFKNLECILKIKLSKFPKFNFWQFRKIFKISSNSYKNFSETKNDNLTFFPSFEPKISVDYWFKITKLT